MFSGHFGNTGPVDHPYIICVTLPREIHFFLYGAWLKPYINIKLWNSCLRFWRGAKNIKDSPEWQILKILTCTAFVSYVKLDTLLYKCPETRHPIWYVLKLINVHSLKLYHLFIWNVSEICSRVMLCIVEKNISFECWNLTSSFWPLFIKSGTTFDCAHEITWAIQCIWTNRKSALV